MGRIFTFSSFSPVRSKPAMIGLMTSSGISATTSGSADLSAPNASKNTVPHTSGTFVSVRIASKPPSIPFGVVLPVAAIADEVQKST